MEMEVDLGIGEDEKTIVEDSTRERVSENGEEEDEYCVGDFVWSRIKKHQWWPGQIYDPSDASDLALKTKQKGKFLVAYFGDKTFAWCGSSQLKPFVESFKECSKISNSRGFLGAVEEAVEEMGRHIELLLISDFVEQKQHFDSPEAKNDGIKEGVFVCDVRREVISSLLVGKTEGILTEVKGLAETVSFSCLLELEILKRMISSFYQSKRGYGLTEYHEPQSVLGLEDKNNDDGDDDDEVENIDDGIKWRCSGVKRSSKEQEEEALNPEESLQRPLENCSGFPDHRRQHRRKQKSIAEILENGSAAKVRFKRVPMDGNVKSSKKNEVKGDLEKESTTTPRRRRMSKISSIEDTGRTKVEENSKGKTSSRKSKKRDVDDDEDGEESAHVEEIEKNEVLDPEIVIDSTPLASLRKRARVDVSSVERNTGNGETATQTSKRERKKSKYFSPDYLLDFSVKRCKKSEIGTESSKVSSQSQVGEQTTDVSDKGVAVEEDKLDKPCEPSLDNGISHQELPEELSKAVDFLRLGATPKEMRDLIRVTALGTQYPKDSSSRDMVTEFISIYRSFTYHGGVNSKFLGSYSSSDKVMEEVNETGKSETKEKERKYNKRKSRRETEENEQIGKEENETPKKERKPKQSKKLGGGEDETWKEASESTKKERKPKEFKSKKQGDEEEEEEEETLKEMSESTQKERRHNESESKKQAGEEEETLKVSNESMKKERKPKKPKYEEEEMHNETEKAEKKKKKREGKLKKQTEIETEKKFSGAELFITFGRCSSMPKKEDLIKTYEKFGALDEDRTYMTYLNFSARVAFLNIVDGEKAFESSQERCPFASASASTVKFRLKYPKETRKEKKMEMEYVKKKLEEMRSLLDECVGGMTEEVKVKLEDKIVNLQEKVRNMRSS